jgi:hypothetical protein
MIVPEDELKTLRVHEAISPFRPMASPSPDRTLDHS